MARVEPPSSLVTVWQDNATSRAVCACATRRHDGVSQGAYASNNLALHVGDDPQHVRRNREGVYLQLGTHQIQWLDQVHGRVCVRADASTVTDAPEADAVWTDQPRIALAILTADCVPVLLRDLDGRCVGAAHAGWQGLALGVIDELIRAMPVNPMRLSAWIGPCIGACCYEVGEEVWREFADAYPDAVLAHADAAKRYLNLAQVARHQLSEAGVEYVSDSGICTYCDDGFYSHRRAVHTGEAPTGRFASLIMLE